MVEINAEQQGNETRLTSFPTNPTLIACEARKLATKGVMLVLQLPAREPRLPLSLLPSEERRRTTAGKTVDRWIRRCRHQIEGLPGTPAPMLVEVTVRSCKSANQIRLPLNGVTKGKTISIVRKPSTPRPRMTLKPKPPCKMLASAVARDIRQGEMRRRTLFLEIL
jgi:hypothetical protein